MDAAIACFGHQPSGLQGFLDPRVAELDVMFLSPLLMEVAHAEIEIWISIQPEHLLNRHYWNCLVAGTTPSLIQNVSIFSCRRFHRLIVRSVTPIISAACIHVIFLAIARMNTSCTFIARSNATVGYRLIPTSGPEASPNSSPNADN